MNSGTISGMKTNTPCLPKYPGSCAETPEKDDVSMKWCNDTEGMSQKYRHNIIILGSSSKYEVPYIRTKLQLRILEIKLGPKLNH